MKPYKKAAALTLCLFALGGFAAVYAKAPTLDPAEDAKHLGPADKFLFWTPEQQVAGYRNIDKVFPTRKIPAGSTVLELPQSLRNLAAVEIKTHAHSLTVDEYFVQQNVAGLLVLKDGQVVYERYGLGNTPDSLWVSFSVTKSVTSMLLGAAIQDGYIKNADEKVTEYLPHLKGSAYDQTTIRNLLQMSSGVKWNEDYADPESDVNTATWETLRLYEYLRNKPRVAPAGTVFNYNTAETNLAGTLLRSAIGNNLSVYLSEKIWRPFGMESDANWMLTEAGGGEWGGCCISATLRDYGRLGLFALHNGQLADGTPVLPEGWMEESTAPSQANPGYGYFWWLNQDGSYRASGIFGQAIYINPTENVVIAMHSARPTASNQPDWDLQFALFTALTEAASRTAED